MQQEVRNAPISSGNVDRARLALLRSIYDDEDREVKVKRQAVRQLMGPIIAARKSGMSFEEITVVFAGEGLQISPATLRSYYFDFRAEIEANKVTARLVEQTIEAKNQLSTVREIKKGADANRTVIKDARRKLRNQAVVVSTSELLASGHLQESDPGNDRQAKSKPPAASAATRRPPTQSRPATPHASPPQRSQPRGGSDADAQRRPAGLAPSLEDLRKYAENADGKEELSEDVLLKTDNRVYYASGEPFDGILTSRQLRLLEVSRRLVAPKKEGGGQRTAGSFTKLPGEL